MPLDPYIAEMVEPLWSIPVQDSYPPELQQEIWDVFLDRREYVNRPQVLEETRDIEGAYPCRIRIYTPPTPSPAPRRALVWAHGGGFVSGTLDDHEADTVAREVCITGDVVVVSVDYPLGNGADIGYPLLHRSFIAALEWTRGNATRLGIDPEFISLGGASAGGNLTLAAALELRDTAREMPTSLVLVYPAISRTHMTHDAHEELMREITPLLRIEQRAIQDIFDVYTAGSPETTYVSWETTPLGDLPPMLVVVSEYDDLRVPVEVILHRPEHQDLDVQWHFAEGVPHGHLSLVPLVPETRATLDKIAAYLIR